MKKQILLMLFISLICSFFGCGNSSCPKDVSSLSVNDVVYSYYSIYEQISVDGLSPFDEFAKNNPIDTEMEKRLSEGTIVSTRDFQEVFDYYIILWKVELETALSSIKKYCDEETKEEIDLTQEEWKKNMEDSCAFDQKYIQKNQIDLGTQYVPSTLIYILQQHKERVFHVKYLIYLAETQDMSIKEEDMQWNKFAFMP